jgi:hypothetical protein
MYLIANKKHRELCAKQMKFLEKIISKKKTQPHLFSTKYTTFVHKQKKLYILIFI